MQLPNNERADDAYQTPEQIALAKLERAELWHFVLQNVRSEQERIVLLESFVYLLPPPTIQERHSDLFPDTGTVYRAKCNLLQRLLQATSRRSHHASVLINISDNPLDLGLFDGQIADAIARGHVGDQRGGSGGLAVET